MGLQSLLRTTPVFDHPSFGGELANANHPCIVTSGINHSRDGYYFDPDTVISKIAVLPPAGFEELVRIAIYLAFCPSRLSVTRPLDALELLLIARV